MLGPASTVARGADCREYPDIASVPVAKEAVLSQLVLTESFSAKVADRHAAPKMEERLIKTDRTSPGVQVTQLGQQLGRQTCCDVLLNIFANGLRDLDPKLLGR